MADPAARNSSSLGGAARTVPFFSRLGVKHGIVLAALVALAMTLITLQQLRATLLQIEQRSEDKGRAIAGALVPMVREHLQQKDTAALKSYFDRIERMNDIDYIQVVDQDGRVLLSSEVGPQERAPHALHPGWLYHLGQSSDLLDRAPAAKSWESGSGSSKKGIDVYASLAPDPERAAREEIVKAPHLRLGLNFDDVVESVTPRVILQMAVFSIVVAAVMVVGLILLLAHILRPLRELHAGLQAVAAGDLNVEVAVSGRDEVARVVQAFNATTARLRAAFEQIEALATTDPLTGLPNRRVFDERMVTESARSRRYGHPFGLIMLDLDNFKDINDRYGHPAGDEVLKSVARTIEASVRETDLPARVGGEEFAVLLPETESGEVRSVAEKLRLAVAETTLLAKHGLPEGVHITISAGAACSAGHLVTPESMLAAADAALYRSKGEGRNRTTMAQRVAGQTGVLKEGEGKPGA